ncbi:MAG: hypothetical protein DMF31_12605 [Verrucomicrobia bacterium]|nr:MAG: hypothetical protein DMF31_12605 [Verrucomicrobiota bacterium]
MLRNEGAAFLLNSTSGKLRLLPAVGEIGFIIFSPLLPVTDAMLVPSTKIKLHGAAHQRLTLDETKRSRVPLDSVVGLFRPKFGTRLWSARTCPRFRKRRHVAALKS